MDTPASMVVKNSCRVSVTVPPATYDELVAAAEKKGLSPGLWLRTVVFELLRSG